MIVNCPQPCAKSKILRVNHKSNPRISFLTSIKVTCYLPCVALECDTILLPEADSQWRDTKPTNVQLKTFIKQQVKGWHIFNYGLKRLPALSAITMMMMTMIIRMMVMMKMKIEDDDDDNDIFNDFSVDLFCFPK